MSITEIITHEECLSHNPGEAHPESPLRLLTAIKLLEGQYPRTGDARVSWEEAPLATQEDLRLCHTDEYINNLTKIIEQIPSDGGIVSSDIDTCVSKGSLNAALRGVGAVCKAIDDVYSGKAKNAFCLTRPPGHHALKASSMGFCLFGNAAVAAHHALRKESIQRVAIVDFDVHHGNGTQELVENNPNILFFSIHQEELWPYQGKSVDRGACGNIRNYPVQEKSDPKIYHQIFQENILPELEMFKPDLIIVSAGFDAHKDDPPDSNLFNDPAGRQLLSEDDFNQFTKYLLQVADKCAQGRLISILEGGYNVDVLSKCCVEHVKTLSHHSSTTRSNH